MVLVISPFHPPQAAQPSSDQHRHRERHSAQRGSAPSSRPGHADHLGVHAAADGGADQTRLRVLEPFFSVSRPDTNAVFMSSEFVLGKFLFALVIRVGGTGGWSSKGCELLNRNSSHISCQCNHMTSFAVLMDISKREVTRRLQIGDPVRRRSFGRIPL